MNSKFYKYCIVPECESTTIKTPAKLFIYVPNKMQIRTKWLKLARREPGSLSVDTRVYFCEDHFDLPNDMENYMQYHIMGSVSQIRLRPGCLPSKFDCQKDRTKICGRLREPYDKKQMAITGECLSKSAETSNCSVSNGKTSGSTSKGSLSAIKRCDACCNGTSYEEITGDVDSSDNLSLYCDDKELTPVPRSTDTKEVHVDTTSSTGAKGITVLHEGFHCHVCTGQITGFRYTCVECSDFDMCRSCEADGRHDQHYVLRIAPDRPAAEFGAVLGGIRSLLMKELDPLATEQQSQQPQDISIKFENAADDQFEVDEEPPTASKPRDDSNQEYGQTDEVDETPIIISMKEELARKCLEVQYELGDVAMARTDLACKPMILINAGRIMNKPCDVSSCSRAPDSRPSNDAPETTIPVKKVRLKCRELARRETTLKHGSNDTVDTSIGNDTDVSSQSSSDFIISNTISIVADTSNR